MRGDNGNKIEEIFFRNEGGGYLSGVESRRAGEEQKAWGGER